ncbi:polysaccharide deacetylase, partial [Streptomyces sp. NPDC052127]
MGRPDGRRAGRPDRRGPPGGRSEVDVHHRARRRDPAPAPDGDRERGARCRPGGRGRPAPTVFMTGRWAEEYPDQARSLGQDPGFE